MGKDRSEKKKHDSSQVKQDNEQHFGPALPPSLQDSSAGPSRDSWMQGEDSLSFLETKTFSNKETKPQKEKTPEYDYSAAGLHIMGKTSSKSNRLFSSRKEDSQNEKTKQRIEDMKARFKKSIRYDEDMNDKRSGSRMSNFKAPSYEKHDAYRYHRHDKKRYSRSKSRSPKRHHTSSNSHKHERKRYSRSRSKSPKRDHSKRTRSKSPPSSIVKKSQTSEAVKNVHSMTAKNEDSKTATLSEEEKASQEKIITNDDLNKLSAKILKAEIMGNSEKAGKLTKKLDKMKKVKQTQSSRPSIREETVILTTTDSKGNIRPIDIDSESRGKGKKRRKEKTTNTHDSSGTRDKYFPDDNKKSLSDLLMEEKSINKLGQDQIFMKYAGKLAKMSSDRQNWTIDDMFESNVAKEKSSSKDVDKIISQNQKEHKRLESCHMCIEKCSKDCIVYIGTTLYIRVPLHKSLTSYQCQIVPVNHITTTVNGDEDFWDELTSVRSALVKKFATKELDIVFLESAQRLGQRRHIFIDCIPVPMEEGAMLPAYFKKAILDCDVEWAQNKKLIDTRKKGLRKSVPQGLPYFSVEFGNDGGFAHVIEEESLFKRYFGLEVIGGVLDCDVNLWRNPEREAAEGVKYKKRKFEKLSIRFK